MLGIVIVALLVATLLLTLRSGHTGVRSVSAADPARPEFVMAVEGLPGCTTNDPPPTAKGDVVCAITVGSSFSVTTEVQDIGTDLGAGYASRQYVIGWSGSVEGPTKLNDKTITQSCVGFPLIQAAPFQGRHNTAAAACVGFGGALTDTGAASRVTWQFNCDALGQGLVSMLVQAPPASNTNLEAGGILTDKDGTEVLTIDCVPGPAPTPLPTPTPVPPSQGVAVAAGFVHTCALTDVGGVKCWGPAFGPLPADVIGLTGVAAISAGVGFHTCAVTASGGAKCWGANNAGQLGDGTQTNSAATPVDVVGLTSGVVAIAGGGLHTCAVTASGGAKCWGNNLNGQLGDGTTVDSITPVDVQSLTSGVAAIAAGNRHTCALMIAGGVKCWGLNNAGQLGDGTNVSTPTPVDVQGLTSGVAVIDLGHFHTCAVTASGGAKCWGSNFSGQLGDGTQADSATPVDVAGLTSGVAAISAGTDHTCVLTTGNGAKCWGENSIGQLGDGTNFNSFTPVDVLGLSHGVTGISAGLLHTCALVAPGGIRCWGSNQTGQLGFETNVACVCSTSPQDVLGFSPKTVGGYAVGLVQTSGQSLQRGSLVLALTGAFLALVAITAGAIGYSRQRRSRQP